MDTTLKTTVLMDGRRVYCGIDNDGNLCTVWRTDDDAITTMPWYINEIAATLHQNTTFNDFEDRMPDIFPKLMTVCALDMNEWELDKDYPSDASFICYEYKPFSDEDIHLFAKISKETKIIEYFIVTKPSTRIDFRYSERYDSLFIMKGEAYTYSLYSFDAETRNKILPIMRKIYGKENTDEVS